MKLIKLGLCAGRHDIPNIDGYVFGEITDPTDIRTSNMKWKRHRKRRSLNREGKSD